MLPKSLIWRSSFFQVINLCKIIRNFQIFLEKANINSKSNAFRHFTTDFYLLAFW